LKAAAAAVVLADKGSLSQKMIFEICHFPSFSSGWMSEPTSEKKARGRSYRKSTQVVPKSIGLFLEPHAAARQAKG
jgi:hypothetical protein